jgi:cell division protein FtsQ
MAARGFGVLFIGAALLSGVIGGGHLNYPGSPWLKMPGQVAGMFGLAALDIKLSGLRDHEADDVLSAIGVHPGGPLLGFDARNAQKTLETLDWVASASVTRSFPNRLHIEIVEREPFVVWQINKEFKVVDQQGQPMSGVSPATTNMLLHVVGEGANLAAADLVNQIEATPELFLQVQAASYVGGRRWNLLMKNGLVIALPEHGVAPALQMAQNLVFVDVMQSGKVAVLDLRVAGEVAYHVAGPNELLQADPRTTSSLQ